MVSSREARWASYEPMPRLYSRVIRTIIIGVLAAIGEMDTDQQHPSSFVADLQTTKGRVTLVIIWFVIAALVTGTAQNTFTVFSNVDVEPSIVGVATALHTPIIFGALLHGIFSLTFFLVRLPYSISIPAVAIPLLAAGFQIMDANPNPNAFFGYIFGIGLLICILFVHGLSVAIREHRRS